jgi:hypothetical protein
MPSTYELISSQILSTNTSFASFTSIPQTYTDLVILSSLQRNSATAAGRFALQFNTTSSGYSWTTVSGNGSTAGSSRTSTQTDLPLQMQGTTYTANTFASTEFYIPNYTNETNRKLAFMFGTTENNATASDIISYACLSNVTAAITTLTLGSTVMTAGSSIYLYGIKNS